MRYSSCDSAVDLWADVVRDEHICGNRVDSAFISLRLEARGLTTSRVSGRVSIEFKLNLATRRVRCSGSRVHHDFLTFRRRGGKRLKFVTIPKKVDGAQIANYTLHLATVNGG